MMPLAFTRASSAMSRRIKIAILDDYQNVALRSADWSRLGDVDIEVHNDHIGDRNRLLERLAPCAVICAMRERTPFDKALLERLPNLQLIVSTGMKNAAIDVEAAREAGVVVCSTGGSATSAPELTWALLLAAARRLPAELDAMRAGHWQTTIGRDLAGATLALLGLGGIGSTMARYGKAFGMEIIAWSENLDTARAEAAGARRVEKDDLFRQGDFVSVHLRLSPRTRGLVDARALSLMKPDAILVNTSRGPIVVEDALIDALRNRRIGGAALDTFDIEPLPADHPFRTLYNVVATGHVGYVTEGSYRTYYGETVENIRAWLDGKPIRVMEP
jgi:phosphoglycerate dehydrogenase-like enzyme